MGRIMMAMKISIPVINRQLSIKTDTPSKSTFMDMKDLDKMDWDRTDWDKMDWDRMAVLLLELAESIKAMVFLWKVHSFVWEIQSIWSASPEALGLQLQQLDMPTQ